MYRCTLIRFLALFSFLFAGISLAEFNVWQPDDGVKIRQGEHIYWFPDGGTATHTDGSWCVVWSDAREGAQNVYIQKFNSDGDPQWTPGGVQVTSGGWAQDTPQALPLPNGEWLVAWRDYRNGTSKGAPGNFYTQLISESGELLWDPDGVSPFIEDDVPTRMFLVPGDDCAGIAVWSYYDGSYAQKLGMDGTPQFETDIDLGTDYISNVVSDNSGGMLFGFMVNYDDLFVNRMNESGELVWGEDQEGIIVLPSLGGPYPFCDMLSDSEGGMYLVWSTESSDEFSDVYGQHVDSEGNLLWTDEEFPVLAGGDGFQHRHNVHLNSDGTLSVVWIDSDDWHDNSAIRAQKITSPGNAPVYLWGEGERGILLGEGYIPSSKSIFISESSSNETIVTWKMCESGYNDPCFAHGAVLTASGETTWNHQLDLSYVENDYFAGPSSVVSNDNLHLVWYRPVPAMCDLATKPFTLSSGDPVNDIPTQIMAGFSGDIFNPIITRSGDNVYIGWHDNRFLGQGDLVFMQRVDFLSGETYWDDNGINITPAFGNDPESDDLFGTYSLQMIPDNAGGVLSAWNSYSYLDGEDYDPCIRLQRTDDSGTPLWGDEGLIYSLELHPEYESPSYPILIPSDDGGMYLFTTAQEYDTDMEGIWMQKFDSNGQPVFDELDGYLLDYRERYVTVQDVVQLDDGSMVVFYSARNHSNEPTLFALKVSSEGELEWEDPVEVIVHGQNLYRIRRMETVQAGEYIIPVILVSNSSGYTRAVLFNGVQPDGSLMLTEPAPIPTGEMYVTQFSVCDRDDESFWFTTRIEYQFNVDVFSIDGTIISEEPILIADPENLLSEPTFVTDEAGGAYLFWTSGESWYDTDQSFVHFDINGEFTNESYSSNGVYLTQAVYQQEQLCVIPDGEGGVLAAWNDYRGRRGAVEADDCYAMRIHESLAGVEEQTRITPLAWSLSPAYPNPFNPSTTIGYSVPVQSVVQLAVFDILGRQVTTLSNRYQQAGRHSVVWDGRSFNGGVVSSGVYFIRMEGGAFSAVQKVVLTK